MRGKRRFVIAGVVVVMAVGGGLWWAGVSSSASSRAVACSQATAQAQSDDATIAAAELLAEQRDTNLAGPKIVDVPCNTDEAYFYQATGATGSPPLVSITVVNRGDCNLGVISTLTTSSPGQGIPPPPPGTVVHPGEVNTHVGRFSSIDVSCFSGNGRCKFEVTVTKVSD